MTWADAFKTITAALAALGGGGAIVLAFSGWIGRVWASRLMEADRAQHAAEIERLRADLTNENTQRLAAIQQQNAERLAAVSAEFDILRERFLRTHSDKLATYRLVADIITGLLADFDRFIAGTLQPAEVPQIISQFNRERLRAYAYAAMLAPQSIIDAHDALMDYLLATINGGPFDWAHMRSLALNVLNRVREDVGLDTTPIEYRGAR